MKRRNVACKAVMLFLVLYVGMGHAAEIPVIVWNKIYDSGSNDEAHGIAVDVLGNVYVTGRSFNGTNYDFRTIKYDANGNILWNKTYAIGPYNLATGIAVDGSGSVYVTGWSGNGTNSDFRTIKYDTDGNIVWNKAYDSGKEDMGYGITVDGSGSVYVTGWSANMNADYRTIKYDASGNVVWNKTYDGGDQDLAYSIAIDGSGNVCVTGGSSNGSTIDYRTIKYNASGNVVWNKTYDGGHDDIAYGIAVDGSGNVCVTGESANGSNRDSRTIKYAPNGSIVWNKTYDDGYDDKGFGIAVDGSGNVYITGDDTSLNRGYRTIKYDAGGNMICTTNYIAGPGDYSYSIAADGAGNVYVTGISSNGSNWDYRTIKYRFDTIPVSPIQPSGPGSGSACANLIYTTSATDSDGDQVKYGWDWDGDGTVDEWSGLVASGTPDSRSHAWPSLGNYSVKVKAEDSYGVQSGWSLAKSITIGNPISVSVQKTISPPNPGNGTPITFQIVVRNTGNATIDSIAITDTLAAQVAFAGEDHSLVPSLAFMSAGSVLAWSGPVALAPSQSLTITVSGTTAVCYTGVVSNTAWVYAWNACGASQTKSVNGFTLGTPLITVAMQTTVIPSSPLPGQQLLYRITLTNTSAATVTDIMVVDTLPTQVTYVNEDHSLAPSFAFTSAGSVLSWEGALLLSPSQSFTVTVSGTAATCYSGLVSNTAWAYASNVCSNYQAKSAAYFSMSTPVLGIVVQKIFRPPNPGNGMPVTLSIMLINTSLATVNNVVIVDTLDAQVAFISEDHSNAPALAFTQAGPVLGWDGAVTLSPMESLTITVTGLTAQCATGRVSDTVWVSVSSKCDNVQTKLVGFFTMKSASATIAVQKTIPTMPTPGGPLRYLIKVTNTSVVTVTDIMIVDTLPPLVTYTGEAHPSGVLAFSQSGNVLSWDGAGIILSPSAYLTVTVTGTAPLCYKGCISNTAWAWGGNTCTSSQAKSVASFSLAPPTLAMSILKRVVPLSPGNGMPVIYQIVITNNSLATVDNLTISDTLAPQVTLVSEDHSLGPGLVFTQVGSLVAWTGAFTLGPFHSLTVTVTGKTAACFTGLVSDTAWAYVNNTCSNTQAKTTVTFWLAALSLDVRNILSTAMPKSGQALVYRITVTNTSVATVTNIMIVETLPVQLIFTGEEHEAWFNYGINGHRLSWDGNAVILPPSASLTVTVYGTTGAEFTGTVSNAAWAYAWNACGSAQASDAAVFVVPVINYEGPIRVFPNPFHPEKAVGGALKFEGVPAGGKVRIYSVDGIMMWEGSSSGGVLEWKGTTKKGERAPRGIYIWAAEWKGAGKKGRLIVD